MSPFSIYLLAVMFGGPLLLGVLGARSLANSTRTDNDDRSFCWRRIVNSGVLFALAYNCVFLAQELFLVLPKAVMGLKPTLYHNNHDWQVQHPAQDLLQGTGALSIFALGLIFVLVFLWVRRSRGSLSLFAIWMIYQGFTQSLPQLADCVVNPDGDVGHALNYLGVGNLLGAALAYLSFFAVACIGVMLARPLLELAPSPRTVETPLGRTYFVFQVGVIGALVGFLLIVPFRLPGLDRVVGPILIAVFPMFWLLAVAWRIRAPVAVGSTVNDKLLWLPIGALSMLLAVCQLWLARGVRFY